MSANLESLFGLSATLSAAAFLPMTPWWADQFRRYHEHPTARRFVGRVGRGGIKSTSVVDEAINQTVFGEWRVPPGEVHYFAWVSQNKSEAGQRIRQIAARLRALAIPFDQSGDEIILRDMPRGFRVFACQVGAVSGFRCFGFCADELAKWTNASDSANPAPEVVASLRAMTVTHTAAREYFISSPLGKTGLHYDLVEAGDTAEQVVCEAPTWVANPSVTEEQTRRLEPDRRIWAREYAAIPQEAALAAFPEVDVTRAFAARAVPFGPASKVLLLDPSSGGLSSRDRFTWAVASWCSDEFPEEGYVRRVDNSIATWATGEQRKKRGFINWQPRGEPYLQLHEVGAFEGGFAGQVSGDQIADELAKIAKGHGARAVHSDQREALFIESALSRRGLSRFHAHTWTSPSKAAAVTLVRRWLADGSLALPPEAAEFKRELLAFEEVINTSGALTYGARRGGHDDYVALIVTLAHAELNPDTRLPRSNLGPRFRYGRLQNEH